MYPSVEVAKENELLAAAGEEDSEDDNEEESMDESDEEEDEEAAMLTPAIDTQIFKTIAAIKSKAPGVYDSTKKFFTDEQFKASKKQWEQQQANLKSQDKKMTLKDYERKLLLEHGGYVKEEDDDQDHNDNDNGLTHVEEQAQLKKAFQMAAQQDDSDDDTTAGLKRRGQDDSDEDSDEDDGFLVKRDKSKTELDAEEDDYRSFLLSNLKVMNDQWRYSNADLFNWLFRTMKRHPRLLKIGRTLRKTPMSMLMMRSWWSKHDSFWIRKDILTSSSSFIAMYWTVGGWTRRASKTPPITKSSTWIRTWMNNTWMMWTDSKASTTSVMKKSKW